jgi:hypothetical protein
LYNNEKIIAENEEKIRIENSKTYFEYEKPKFQPVPGTDSIKIRIESVKTDSSKKDKSPKINKLFLFIVLVIIAFIIYHLIF